MLRSFHQWLKPEGQVLVQVPDVERNPYDLGVMDHVSHFTNATLRLCARTAGFEIAADGHPWTHNCLTLLLGRPASLTEAAHEPGAVAASSNPFDWLNTQIQFFGRKVGSRGYAIFGTGMASLLLAVQLPRMPRYFVDEDDRRVGGSINGIPILHPQELREPGPIVMPFQSSTSQTLARRLTSQFPVLKPECFLYCE